jgi:VPDSG-CTERM motif
MKINIVPLNKLALISAAVCAAMLAFSHNASANRIVGGINIPTTALTFNDTHVVGTISPAAPASPADVAPYINFMIGLVPGHSGTFHNPPHTQTVTRSSNLFPSLPNALVPGAVSGTGTTINLGAGGVFSYLFAKYDGQNDISQVWYVGNLSGILTIPLDGPLGHGLSGWILFGPGGTPSVPDGGTTVMLLGAALGALGVARRFLMN